jgi:CRISPR system Cascade subunit CasC
MKFIALHILRSLPFSCVNRGEDGAPKSCIFGGTIRARISSQSIKRAIREYLKGKNKDFFRGCRTKHIVKLLTDFFKNNQVGNSEDLAKAVTSILSDKFEEGIRTKTVLFLSNGEIELIGQAALSVNEPERLVEKKTPESSGEKKASKKKVKKTEEPVKVVEDTAKKTEEPVEAVEDELLDIKYTASEKLTKAVKTQLKSLKGLTAKDTADIGIFGRMVTSLDINVDSAIACSHPLSVHEVTNEIDYFTAVDDVAPNKGAAHVDEALYNSATYYQAIFINVDQLKTNLSVFTTEQFKVILDLLLRGCMLSLPEGKKNTAFGITPPSYAKGLLIEGGSPLTLANAYEAVLNPSNNGYVENATTVLKQEWDKQNKDLGDELGKIKTEVEFPNKNLTDFCKELTDSCLNISF